VISRWDDRQLRGADAHGNGAFAASRGSKRHKGVDYAFNPGEEVRSPVEGIVTRLGYAYKDEPFRLIEILSHKGHLLWRFLYVRPDELKAGDKVLVNDVIGVSQNISQKYNKPGKRMVNHVHVEINLNPKSVLGGHNGSGT